MDSFNTSTCTESPKVSSSVQLKRNKTFMDSIKDSGTNPTNGLNLSIDEGTVKDFALCSLAQSFPYTIKKGKEKEGEYENGDEEKRMEDENAKKKRKTKSSDKNMTTTKRMGIRKCGYKSRRSKEVKLPLENPALAITYISNLKYVFVVDLMSYSGKTCNKLLHQMLFGRVKNENDVKIFIVMKAKFSPACKECGIGGKNETLFLKDRFVQEGNGRTILNVDASQSSIMYRTKLAQFLYDHQRNPIIVSEDIQYGFKIIGSSFSEEDTKEYLDLFELDDSISFLHPTIETAKTASTATKKKSGTKRGGGGEDEIDEEIRLEKEEKTLTFVQDWIKNRIQNEGGTINLPKSRDAFCNAISKFCKITYTIPMSDSLKILYDSGDIKICSTCATVKPVSTDTSNQFYFSFGSLTMEQSTKCTNLMNKIITEYQKKTPPIPISLSTLRSISFSKSITLDPQLIFNRLVERGVISIETIPDPSDQYKTKTTLCYLNNTTVNNNLDTNTIEIEQQEVTELPSLVPLVISDQSSSIDQPTITEPPQPSVGYKSKSLESPFKKVGFKNTTTSTTTSTTKSLASPFKSKTTNTDPKYPWRK
eukprot:gene7538-9268_t